MTTTRWRSPRVHELSWNGRHRASPLRLRGRHGHAPQHRRASLPERPGGRLTRGRAVIKHTIDLVGAATLLVLLSPLFACIFSPSCSTAAVRSSSASAASACTQILPDHQVPTLAPAGLESELPALELTPESIALHVEQANRTRPSRDARGHGCARRASTSCPAPQCARRTHEPRRSTPALPPRGRCARGLGAAAPRGVPRDHRAVAGGEARSPGRSGSASTTARSPLVTALRHARPSRPLGVVLHRRGAE